MRKFVKLAAITILSALCLSLKSTEAKGQTIRQSAEVVVSPQMNDAKLEVIKYMRALDSLRASPTKNADSIAKLREAVSLSCLKATYYAQLSNKPKNNRVIRFDEKNSIFAW